MAKKWDEVLIARLKDENQAIAYLNAAIEDTKDGTPESQELLAVALRNIAKAKGVFFPV